MRAPPRSTTPYEGAQSRVMRDQQAAPAHPRAFSGDPDYGPPGGDGGGAAFPGDAAYGNRGGGGQRGGGYGAEDSLDAHGASFHARASPHANGRSSRNIAQNET